MVKTGDRRHLFVVAAAVDAAAIAIVVVVFVVTSVVGRPNIFCQRLHITFRQIRGALNKFNGAHIGGLSCVLHLWL